MVTIYFVFPHYIAEYMLDLIRYSPQCDWYSYVTLVIFVYILILLYAIA